MIEWEWAETTPALDRFAYGLGVERCDYCVERGLEHTNNLKMTYEDSQVQSVLGTRTESAAWVWLDGPHGSGVHWNRYNNSVGMNNVADLYAGSLHIDVKGVWDNTLGLLIPVEKVHEDWAYLLVGAFYRPRFAIMGWAWGRELLQIPVSYPQKDRPCHLMGQSSPLMRCPASLRKLVRESFPVVA